MTAKSRLAGTTAPDLTAFVREVVGRVVDPELRRPLAELGMIRDVRVTGAAAVVEVALTISTCPAADRIKADVLAAADTVEGLNEVQVVLTVMTEQERVALTSKLRDGRSLTGTPFTAQSLTRVIAVTSGKGGVGKSSVTANLAVAMAAQGIRVGIVDADVHGFSIPGLLGLIGDDGETLRPTRVEDLVLPPVGYGVKTISIGMFLPEGDTDAVVSWRGPMLHRTLDQFITDVFFGDLDVLLIDMPPGTGDVAISVGQLLPHAEVIVVTTPQCAATEVAVRSAFLARKLGQRIIGVVETMAPMHLPDGSEFAPFGTGGGNTLAERLSTNGEVVPLLGSVPFSPALRVAGDTGTPVAASDPADPAAQVFTSLATALSIRPRGLPGRRLPVSLS